MKSENTVRWQRIIILITSLQSFLHSLKVQTKYKRLSWCYAHFKSLFNYMEKYGSNVLGPITYRKEHTTRITLTAWTLRACEHIALAESQMINNWLSNWDHMHWAESPEIPFVNGYVIANVNYPITARGETALFSLRGIGMGNFMPANCGTIIC